tara:strand:- start:1242 stop:1361 length:120 start_codon:yes stop_codon:yes gene_type:complete
MYMEIFYNIICYIAGMVTGSIITARYLLERFDDDGEDGK